MLQLVQIPAGTPNPDHGNQRGTGTRSTQEKEEREVSCLGLGLATVTLDNVGLGSDLLNHPREHRKGSSCEQFSDVKYCL
jgi:hypothetical protein